MKSLLLSGIFMIGLGVFSQAQIGILKWTQAYGGTAVDEGISIFPSSNNEYVIWGNTRSTDGDISNPLGRADIWMLKIGEEGELLSEKTFGTAKDEFISDVAMTNDKGYILAGYSQHEDFVANNELWVAKSDSSGNLLWHQSYGGSYREAAHAIKQTSDGGYLVAGNTGSEEILGYPGMNNFAAWVLKLDRSGEIEWEQALGRPFSSFYDVAENMQGNYVLVGGTNKGGGGINVDCWLLELDKQGEIILNKTYGGSKYDAWKTITILSDGGYLLGGDVQSRDGQAVGLVGRQDCWLVRTDDQGNIEWQKTFGGNEYEFISYAQPYPEGGYLVGGTTESVDGDVLGNAGARDMWVVWLEEEEGIKWQRTIGGEGNENLSDILLSESSSFIFTGSTQSLDGDFTDNSDARLGNLAIGQVRIVDQPNRISGRFYYDKNGNCQFDPGDVGLPNILIQTEEYGYGQTDEQGIFTLLADSGHISFRPIFPFKDGIYTPYCPGNPEGYSFSLTELNQTLTGYDFAYDVIPCALLQANVTAGWRRLCSRSTTSINYQNHGLSQANNAKIRVKYPEYLIPLSANLSWQKLDDFTYEFSLGDLAPFESGVITLVDSILCGNPDSLLGLTQCVEAWILPANNCENPDPKWSGADLSVTGSCIQARTIQFVLKNSGDRMQDSSSFRIYQDSAIVYEGKTLLDKADSLSIRFPSGGFTYRLEVNQVPFHPRNTFVSATVYGCGSTSRNAPSSWFPEPEEALEKSIDCGIIAGSYDPNDKQVFPSGWGEAHNIFPKTRLEYKIRFQNTGTDTAFIVRLIDTLSAKLDISTLHEQGSSHPYTLTISGTNPPVLDFLFENIVLPDSNVNEPLSHGYVQFSILPDSTLPLKSRIENFADIYFDFNPPVRTNTTWITLDTIQVFNPQGLDKLTINQGSSLTHTYQDISHEIKLIPNPATDVLEIHLGTSLNMSRQGYLDIYNSVGAIVLHMPLHYLSNGKGELEVGSLPNGIYYFRVKQGNKWGIQSFQVQ